MYKFNLEMTYSKEIVYRKTWRLKLFVSILICLFTVDVTADISQKIEITKPDPEGTPTEVQVSFYVVNIESIDNVGQNYTVDFILILSWQDARLRVVPAVWNEVTGAYPPYRVGVPTEESPTF